MSGREGVAATDGGERTDGGPIGRREIAYRLFAAEFEDADLEYSDSDEERAPNYVVTPTGARVNRLFVVGVLTEIERVSDDVLRARIVDPSGAFVVYAGQYQPEAVAFLEGAEVPSFVAVTGKARTFRPEGADRVFTSVRPETMTAVDAETRDRWTVQAAEHTLARVATMARALDREERGEPLAAALRDAGVEPGLAAGVALALDHYGTTAAYLAAVRELAVAAAEVVAGDRDEAPPLEVAPDEGGSVDADLTAAPPVAGTLGGDHDAEALREPAAPAAAVDAPAAESSAEGAQEPAETSAETGAASAPSEAEPGAESDAAEPEPQEPEAEPAEPAAADAEAAEAPAATDDLGDFEDYGEASDAVAAGGEGDRYELDEAERERVEAEFDTEFSTAGEVGEPGEAGIEPEVEQPPTEPAEPTEATEPAESDQPAEPDEAGVEAGETATAGAVDEADGGPNGATTDDVDLEDAVVEAMADLDDGDGADREAVVAAVVEAHGVEVDAVEAAIRDALMDGRCYEPADGTLTAI